MYAKESWLYSHVHGTKNISAFSCPEEKLYVCICIIIRHFVSRAMYVQENSTLQLSDLLALLANPHLLVNCITAKRSQASKVVLEVGFLELCYNVHQVL